MENIASLLRTGEAELAAAEIPEARREAALLLAAAIGCEGTFLIAHPEYVPEAGSRARYQDFTARRAAREPFHYIVGRKEFFGLEFLVSPSVLIPRPETEMLVERGIESLRDAREPRFCEVGVGSGCISVSILVNVTDAVGVGLDISEPAIEVARQNAGLQAVEGRFDLRRSDVLAGLGRDETFDLIVSNPPYVPAGDIEGLQAEVRDHEPHIALSGGQDGLAVVRKLIADSPKFLKPGGTLMIEFGFSQSEAVIGMFAADIWSTAVAETDLQGIPRIVKAVLNR